MLETLQSFRPVFGRKDLPSPMANFHWQCRAILRNLWSQWTAPASRPLRTKGTYDLVHMRNVSSVYNNAHGLEDHLPIQSIPNGNVQEPLTRSPPCMPAWLALQNVRIYHRASCSRLHKCQCEISCIVPHWCSWRNSTGPYCLDYHVRQGPRSTVVPPTSWGQCPRRCATCMGCICIYLESPYRLDAKDSPSNMYSKRLSGHLQRPSDCHRCALPKVLQGKSPGCALPRLES